MRSMCHAAFGFQIALALLLCMGAPGLAPGGDPSYRTSVHGDTSKGVKRSSNRLRHYAGGNCAHCHEQHASIGGTEPVSGDGASPSMLFVSTDSANQADNFCFECHMPGGGVQEGGIVNRNYGTTFGGGTGDPASTSDVASAFNPTMGDASRHDLGAILDLMKMRWPDLYGDDNNPCSGCHNPHLVQKNNMIGAGFAPDQSAIILPGTPLERVGDDDSERMSRYSDYRAPFFVGANSAVNPTLHEPDGVSRHIDSPEVQGTTTPDYVTFCLGCHNDAIGSDIKRIDWYSDMHGMGQRTFQADDKGALRAPYTTTGTISSAEASLNFVLSCLDCHEPHGTNAANATSLLRTTVNGEEGVTFPSIGDWTGFCGTCHVFREHGKNSDVDNTHSDINVPCFQCHWHGKKF